MIYPRHITLIHLLLSLHSSGMLHPSLANVYILSDTNSQMTFENLRAGVGCTCNDLNLVFKFSLVLVLHSSYVCVSDWSKD